MPRQLKTYVTTSGFFELAVAAPTMKAAIEIWGASPDVFHRGYAKISDDPAIVKATMAKPGVVLKRGVGAKGAFSENPNLADIALTDKTARTQQKPKPPARSEPAKAEPAKAKKADAAAQQKAARQYERSQKHRERERARAEAAERKAGERRDRDIKQAEGALAAARDEHIARMADIERKRAILERAAHDEDARWATEKQRREDALRKAGD